MKKLIYDKNGLKLFEDEYKTDNYSLKLTHINAGNTNQAIYSLFLRDHHIADLIITCSEDQTYKVDIYSDLITVEDRKIPILNKLWSKAGAFQTGKNKYYIITVDLAYIPKVFNDDFNEETYERLFG